MTPSESTLSKLFLFVAALTLCGGSAFGQTLMLHMPLDGTLASRGTIKAAPKMYVKAGESEPEVVPGRIGQALLFDSKATIAVPFNLDHDKYPVVTITAWVKQGLAANDTRAILSSGSDAGARLGVNGGRLAAKAGRTGVSFDQDMPRGEWVFVAAVIDIAKHYARLHQNDAVYVRENIDTSAKLPREFSNPYDKGAAKQPYLFVGALQFRNWQQTARRLTIDDVRLYSGALSVDQINKLRNSAPSSSPAAATGKPGVVPVEPSQLPGDQFEPTQLPGDQFEPTQLPGDQFEPTELPADREGSAAARTEDVIDLPKPDVGER